MFLAAIVGSSLLYAPPEADRAIDVPLAAPTAEQTPEPGSSPPLDSRPVSPGTARSDQPKVPAPGSSPVGDFFAPGTASAPASTTPTMPPIEELPPRGTPSKPPVEELPARRGPPIVLGGAKDRKPISGGGASFFDPGKLSGDDAGSSGIQVRGYLGFNFSVTERTNVTARNPDTGTFDRLRTLPYFGGGAANLYVGAPVYSDVVYVRLAFEFLSIPRSAAGAADVSPSFNPVILMESAAVEVNPFTWATRAGRWLREGFKLTGGVFVVPFGIEDEEHDAPVRWWVTRPLAMSAGRVYPGTWIDIGAMIKWKPTFGSAKPIRPIEIDLGVVNGDACTQTRSNDLLYRYQPVGQVDETCERRLRDVEKINRGDGSVLGIAPDNNGNKSFVGRVMIRPVPAVNVGGSVVWGKHPESSFIVSSFLGQTFVDTRQAATWRAGGHLDLNFDEMITSPYPLPHLRGEVVYGVDAAAPPLDADSPILADRRMLGAYAQIAQPLWRRKKTRLPGLIIQYRFDHADPDLAVPGRTTAGQPVLSDFADAFKYDEALQAHVIGLRFPVLPRFTLKAEYDFVREDGGRSNRLFNDAFGFQAVADF